MPHSVTAMQWVWSRLQIPNQPVLYHGEGNLEENSWGKPGLQECGGGKKKGKPPVFLPVVPCSSVLPSGWNLAAPTQQMEVWGWGHPMCFPWRRGTKCWLLYLAFTVLFCDVTCLNLLIFWFLRCLGEFGRGSPGRNPQSLIGWSNYCSVRTKMGQCWGGPPQTPSCPNCALSSGWWDGCYIFWAMAESGLIWQSSQQVLFIIVVGSVRVYRGGYLCH